MFKEVFSLKSVLLYFAIFILSSLVSIFLFAALMLFLEIDFSYATLFGTISVAFGLFITSFCIAKKTKEKGFLIGFVLSVSIFVLITLITLLIGNSAFTLNSVFRLIIYLLSGCCGGIIAVNKASKKKYF